MKNPRKNPALSQRSHCDFSDAEGPRFSLYMRPSAGFGVLAVAASSVLYIEHLLLLSSQRSRNAFSRHWHFRVHATPRQVNASVLLGSVDPACHVKADPARQGAFERHTLPNVTCQDGINPLCSIARFQHVVVTIALWPRQAALLQAFTFSVASLRLPTLISVAEGDVDGATDVVRAAGGTPELVSVVRLPGRGTEGILIRKWALIRSLLELGVTVLYADVDVVLTSRPFELIANDSDVEAVSEAWDNEAARGFIHGSDDPSMGWSEPCRATTAIRLAARIMHFWHCLTAAHVRLVTGGATPNRCASRSSRRA